MSGGKHREKGHRTERKLLNFIERFVFIPSAPLSRDCGNINSYVHGRDATPLIGEARMNGVSFKTLEDWYGKNGIHFLNGNHKSPVVVLPWETWIVLLKRSQP